MVLLDVGTQVNTIVPGYVENHSLDMSDLSQTSQADGSPV